MKKLILFFAVSIIFLSQSIAKAQHQEHVRESWDFQIGGDGITAVSINYDRTIMGSLQGRVGLGYSYSVGKIDVLDHNSLVSIPLQVSYLIGRDGDFLEMISGVTPVYLWDATTQAVPAQEFVVTPSFFIGYRHQPRDNGFLFRVNIGAGYDREGVHIGLGLSFGFVTN